MGRTKESVPQRSPTVFKSQNNVIILNLSLTYYNGIFQSHFQDWPKVTLSFDTKQYCTDVSTNTVYAVG